MKTFTRILLACTAASMLLMPVANAQSRQQSGHHYSQSSKHSQANKHSQVKKPQLHKKAPDRRHWKKGQRYSDWKRAPAVRDYRHRGLKRPGHGQQWVKADNNYLLVSLASGLIVGIAAAR